MPGWPTIGNAKFNHLIKVIRDRSLCGKIYFLLFVIIFKNL